MVNDNLLLREQRPQSAAALIRSEQQFRELGDAFDGIGPGLFIVQSQGISVWIAASAETDQALFSACVADFKHSAAHEATSDAQTWWSQHERKVTDYIRREFASFGSGELQLETRGRSLWITRPCFIRQAETQVAVDELANFLAVVVPLAVAVRDGLGVTSALGLGSSAE